MQSPPGVLEFGNGHLKRKFAGCGITKPPRDRKRSLRPPSDFGVGRRQVENRDWITSPFRGDDDWDCEDNGRDRGDGDVDRDPCVR
jgi:hypothetical protein